MRSLGAAASLCLQNPRPIGRCSSVLSPSSQHGHQASGICRTLSIPQQMLLTAKCRLVDSAAPDELPRSLCHRTSGNVASSVQQCQQRHHHSECLLSTVFQNSLQTHASQWRSAQALPSVAPLDPLHPLERGHSLTYAPPQWFQSLSHSHCAAHKPHPMKRTAGSETSQRISANHLQTSPQSHTMPRTRLHTVACGGRKRWSACAEALLYCLHHLVSSAQSTAQPTGLVAWWQAENRTGASSLQVCSRLERGISVPSLVPIAGVQRRAPRICILLQVPRP
mmetsp:Transcript_68354/g.127565  ORF Transcript_68354/g.127565 Transcript_68354/m.127565 type:complete len:280 (+) Transcript_68354:2422-3261(+)